MNKKTYSFDVFDTVITRIWAKPNDLFWEVARQLRAENLISISPEAWSKLRLESQMLAHRTSDNDAVTLKRIYDFLASSLGWSPSETEIAKQKEILVELSSLRVVPETQRRIVALHQQNHRVIYISDMYLSSETIQLFLEKNQVWAKGDTLYVSSEVGVKKNSGLLFEYCLNRESLKPSQLHHVGDNYRSDIKPARNLGINAESFTQAHLNRYERLIADNPQLPLNFRSLLAGSSRLTRLQCPETDTHRQIIWHTSANVIAPVLFGFVQWCLESAEANRIERLYFVARDGQILLKIAEVLCRNWGYKVDCRYLYGSRQAWHFPAIDSIQEAELEWIFDDTLFLSVRSVCDRVNITPEQIEIPLIENNFVAKAWSQNLNPQERIALRQLFGSDNRIFDLIIAKAGEYRKQAIGYFKQEGLGDDVKFAIVDIGWKARLQRSLSSLLQSAKMYPESGTIGFYFGLKQRDKLNCRDRSLAYLHDEASLSPSPIPFDSLFIRLLEIFVAADHGSTMRFEAVNGRYSPVLRHLKNEKALNWGLQVQQAAIVKSVDNFSSLIECTPIERELYLKTCADLLKTFIETPTKEEAVTFGSYKTAHCITEVVFYDLAPKITLKGSLDILLEIVKLPERVWIQGVICQSQPLTAFILKIVRQKMKLKQKLKTVSLFNKWNQKIAKKFGKTNVIYWE